MRTRISSSAIATTLPLLFCLISIVNATRHRHQQHQQSNTLDSSTESSTLAYNSGSRTVRPRAEPINFNVDFDPSLSAPNTSPNRMVDYIKEFSSRGLFECTAKYLTTLRKIQDLIAEAYAEYKECDTQLKHTPKTYTKTGFNVFDEFLDEWKAEDGGEEGDEENESMESVELRPRH